MRDRCGCGEDWARLMSNGPKSFVVKLCPVCDAGAFETLLDRLVRRKP